MRQAVLQSPRLITLEHPPVPQPREGEVVLQVRAALTCGTDLKTYRRGHPRLGPGPFGHECSGDVVAMGAGVERVGPGDAVMLVPTAPCGECPACRAGAENHCRYLFRDIVLGAYADYLLVSAPVARRHLLPKPQDLSYIEAAFLEPLACVLHGWRRLALPGPSGVAVVGLGAIGLLQILVGRMLGHRMVAVGRRAPRLRLAGRLGAGTVDIEQGEVGEQAAALLGEPSDAVIECTGVQHIWEQVPAWVRSGGRVLLFGGLPPRARATFDATRLHYGEVDLVGAFHFASEDVLEAYRWLSERRIDVRPLISSVRPLDDIVDVFHDLDRGRQVKVALLPEAAGWR